jgi:cytidine deaminase
MADTACLSLRSPLNFEQLVKKGVMMSLIDDAAQVRERAYVPYSNFKVGAAIRTVSGAVHVGCNVENVAYPEGTCAEAGAIAAMVAAGELKIAEVAVIADSPVPVSPCGGCRQKLAEFGEAGVKVTLCTTDGLVFETTIGELLPGVFSTEHMARS